MEVKEELEVNTSDVPFVHDDAGWDGDRPGSTTPKDRYIVSKKIGIEKEKERRLRWRKKGLLNDLKHDATNQTKAQNVYIERLRSQKSVRDMKERALAATKREHMGLVRILSEGKHGVVARMLSEREDARHRAEDSLRKAQMSKSLRLHAQAQSKCLGQMMSRSQRTAERTLHQQLLVQSKLRVLKVRAETIASRECTDAAAYSGTVGRGVYSNSPTAERFGSPALVFAPVYTYGQSQNLTEERPRSSASSPAHQRRQQQLGDQQQIILLTQRQEQEQRELQEIQQQEERGQQHHHQQQKQQQPQQQGQPHGGALERDQHSIRRGSTQTLQFSFCDQLHQRVQPHPYPYPAAGNASLSDIAFQYQSQSLIQQSSLMLAMTGKVESGDGDGESIDIDLDSFDRRSALNSKSIALSVSVSATLPSITGAHSDAQSDTHSEDRDREAEGEGDRDLVYCDAMTDSADWPGEAVAATGEHAKSSLERAGRTASPAGRRGRSLRGVPKPRPQSAAAEVAGISERGGIVGSEESKRAGASMYKEGSIRDLQSLLRVQPASFDALVAPTQTQSRIRSAAVSSKQSAGVVPSPIPAAGVSTTSSSAPALGGVANCGVGSWSAVEREGGGGGGAVREGREPTAERGIKNTFERPHSAAVILRDGTALLDTEDSSPARTTRGGSWLSGRDSAILADAEADRSSRQGHRQNSTMAAAPASSAPPPSPALSPHFKHQQPQHEQQPHDGWSSSMPHISSHISTGARRLSGDSGQQGMPTGYYNGGGEGGGRRARVGIVDEGTGVGTGMSMSAVAPPPCTLAPNLASSYSNPAVVTEIAAIASQLHGQRQQQHQQQQQHRQMQKRGSFQTQQLSQQLSQQAPQAHTLLRTPAQLQALSAQVDAMSAALSNRETVRRRSLQSTVSQISLPSCQSLHSLSREEYSYGPASLPQQQQQQQLPLQLQLKLQQQHHIFSSEKNVVLQMDQVPASGVGFSGAGLAGGCGAGCGSGSGVNSGFNSGFNSARMGPVPYSSPSPPAVGARKVHVIPQIVGRQQQGGSAESESERERRERGRERVREREGYATDMTDDITFSDSLLEDSEEAERDWGGEQARSGNGMREGEKQRCAAGKGSSKGKHGNTVSPPPPSAGRENTGIVYDDETLDEENKEEQLGEQEREQDQDESGSVDTLSHLSNSPLSRTRAAHKLPPNACNHLPSSLSPRPDLSPLSPVSPKSLSRPSHPQTHTGAARPRSLSPPPSPSTSPSIHHSLLRSSPRSSPRSSLRATPRSRSPAHSLSLLSSSPHPSSTLPSISPRG